MPSPLLRRPSPAARLRPPPPRPALALLAALALGGCGSGGGDGEVSGSGAGAGPGPGPGFGANATAPPPTDGAGPRPLTAEDVAGSEACTLEAMNRTVEANMRDYYLFADRVGPAPAAGTAEAGSPETLIRALRVEPPDRFSYVGDAALNAAFFDEGVEFGYGWLIERDAAGRAVVALAKPGSPVDVAGVARGDVLLAIDGTALDEIASAAEADALLGTGRDVRTVRLALEGPGGVRREVDATRGEYDVRAVVDVRVLEPVGPGGPRVGYLHFLSFVETAREELDAAFAHLAAEGVDELVLDLRYNGGGRVDVAATLASRIVGAGGAGRDFARYRFNDAYQAAYEAAGLADALRLPFEPLPDSLDLPRVHVLATGRTCSASEMVINALEPLIDVTVVGAPTCGKPFGTAGREFCGKVMQAVEFEFVNGAGVGGYADGIPADCAAADDLTRPLGDPAEGLLATALARVSGGACAPAFADDPDTGLEPREGDGRGPIAEPTNPYRNELLAR